jgi:hypothetical protein
MVTKLFCVAELLMLAVNLMCISPVAGQVDNREWASRLDRPTESMPVAPPTVAQPPVAPSSPVDEAAAATVAYSAPVPPDGEQYYTLDELRTEMRKLAWTKGDFKIVPYGALWGNSVFSSERTNPGSYTLWVQSASAQGGENEFVVDGRNTRLGIDVLGPKVPLVGCAQSGGKVEIDFQGGFPGVTIQENKGIVLLRHAYVEVKGEDFRLLAGQTWDVISPLNPGMLMYSVGWDGGNIGYRRAQFRAERYLACSDCALLTLQGSINQNCYEASGNARSEYAGWPVIEGRAAVTLGERKGPDALPIAFGVSSHIGNEQFDITGGSQNLDVPTWSLNADLRIPITQRLGFQAEFFTGSNLDAFLGGVGQGIDPVTFQGIRSTGCWCEVWYDWTPSFHSHVGYSLDDPNDDDLHLVGERTYNQFYFGNVIYDLTKQFLVGLEVSSWKTLYLGQMPGESVRCEFVAKFAF